MTPNQVKIAEWLKLEVPTLHPAFTKAVELMDGASQGRSNLDCHGCRDICTLIQQYYRVERDERANTAVLLNKLDALWVQNKLYDLTSPTASNLENAEPATLLEDLPVSREVLQMVQSVLQERLRRVSRSRTQTLGMFLGIAPEAAGRPDLYDTHAEQWKRLRGWFHEYAHYTLKERVCDEGELKAHFLLFSKRICSPWLAPSMRG